jgi:hypothetical protein
MFLLHCDAICYTPVLGICKRGLLVTIVGTTTNIVKILKAWDIEHVLPWSLTRDNSDENCMPAHERCHDVKTFSQDIPRIAKAVRLEARHMGFKVSQNPMLGSKRSRFKKRMDGTVERRG